MSYLQTYSPGSASPASSLGTPEWTDFSLVGIITGKIKQIFNYATFIT